MRRILLFAGGLFILFSFFYISSSFQKSKNPNQVGWFCEDAKYTYQFEVHNSRKPFSVPADICETINSSRKKSEITLIQFDENIILKIFPEDEINKGNLTEIPQIVYL